MSGRISLNGLWQTALSPAEHPGCVLQNRWKGCHPLVGEQTLACLLHSVAPPNVSPLGAISTAGG